MSEVLENTSDTGPVALTDSTEPPKPARPKPARPKPADRALPLLIAPEPPQTRWLWLGVLCAIVAMYAFAVFTFWAPADGGVDQNAYLVGGKQIAHSLSTGVFPKSPFEYVGNMFVIPKATNNAANLSLYPKYPFGLPLLYAIVLWLTSWKFGASLAFIVSPTCAVLAVAGMFFLARAAAGSFAAICATIVLATSEVTWQLADVANSHASCLAFVVWGMFLLLRWWQTGSIWRGILAGFLLAYAFTIRYTEGLLIIPIVVAVAMRIRWRNWRSYLRNATPILAWLVPVAAQLLYNYFTIGDWTGYDGSNESEFGRAFTWDKFADTWEQMLRTFHDQGMFFTLPLGVAGLFMLMARSWKTALMLLAWIVPGVAVYTAYYWSPDRGVAYARFFLTFFPALLIGFAVCLRFGIIGDAAGDDADDRPRATRIFLTLAAAVVVAIASGVGTWRAVSGSEDASGGFAQILPLQYRARASLATVGQIVNQRVPKGSLLFAEDGRGFENAANYLAFAGDWQLFTSSSFENRGGRLLRAGPFAADPNNPSPMQPHRRDVMRDLYEGKSDRDLNDEAKKVVEDALAEGRQVFVLSGSSSIDTLRRRFLPGNEFIAKRIERWKDIPEPRDENGVAPTVGRRRRNAFGQPAPNRPGAPEPRPAEWNLFEITLAPVQPKPATKPSMSASTKPSLKPSFIPSLKPGANPGTNPATKPATNPAGPR